MSDAADNNLAKRPVFADANSGFLFTTNPQTGEFMPIVDPATTQPLAKRPLFINPTSGLYCAIDPATGEMSNLTDPFTGEPMRGAPTPPANQQAEAIPEPETEPEPEPEPESEPVTEQEPELELGPSLEVQPEPQPAATATDQFSDEAQRITIPEIRIMREEIAQIKTMLEAQSRIYTSGSAIAALVFGILAVITCFIPLVSIGSILFAIIAIILTLVARSGIRKGKVVGKGIATAATILNIIALIIAISVQVLSVHVVNDFQHRLHYGVAPISVPGCSHTDYSSMKPGQSVPLENGLTVTVNSVDTDLSRLNGAPIVEVSVTYTNNGSSTIEFDPLDWKAETPDGELIVPTVYVRGDDDLGFGTIAPGGSVSGNVYYEGEITKVYYYSRLLLQSDSEICWIVD